MKDVIISFSKLTVSFCHRSIVIPLLFLGGATATVYEAMDTNSNSRVALKVMNSTESHESTQLKMVKREVRFSHFSNPHCF